MAIMLIKLDTRTQMKTINFELIFRLRSVTFVCTYSYICMSMSICILVCVFSEEVGRKTQQIY